MTIRVGTEQHAVSDEVPAAAAAWANAAAGVLARAGRFVPDEVPADPRAVAAVLSVRTADGVQVPALGSPFLTSNRLPVAVPVGAAWDIRSHVAGREPRAVGDLVAEELAGGATSVWLADGVEVPAGVDRALVAPSYDPVGLAARSGDAVDSTALPEMVTGGARGVVADGCVAAGFGAGDVAELAYILASAAHLARAVEAAGVSTSQALAAIELRVTVPAEFFLAIAKVRGLRLCWSRIGELSGMVDSRAHIHAVTARSMLAEVDVPSNLLRLTAAAVAAVAGGVDALTVLPFDALLPRPGAMGRRLARNISHLLARESLLRRDDDPAAGAYALEELTYRTATAAWAEFVGLDGQLDAVIGDGSLRAAWVAAGERRQESVADGSRVIVGVNRYPAPVA